jgi:hypothetical protein
MNPKEIKEEIQRLEKLAKNQRPFTDLHDARTVFNMVQGNINSALMDLRNVQNSIDYIQKQMKEWDFSTLSEDHKTRPNLIDAGGHKWKDLLTDAVEQTEKLCVAAQKDADTLKASLLKIHGPAGKVI